MIRRLAYGCVLTLLIQSMSACSSVNSSNDWRLVKYKNDIAFYMKPKIGSAIPEFRGETVTEGKISDLYDLLMDVKSYPDWVYQCESAQIIQTNGRDSLHIYQVNSLPLLKRRDIVLRGKVESNTGSKLMRIRLVATPDYCDDKDSEKCKTINSSKNVRVTQSTGSFEAEQINESQIKITWQQHINPGGKIPAWVVERQLDNLVFKTLAGLREKISVSKR